MELLLGDKQGRGFSKKTLCSDDCWTRSLEKLATTQEDTPQIRYRAESAWSGYQRRRKCWHAQLTAIMNGVKSYEGTPFYMAVHLFDHS